MLLYSNDQNNATVTANGRATLWTSLLASKPKLLYFCVWYDLQTIPSHCIVRVRQVFKNIKQIKMLVSFLWDQAWFSYIIIKRSISKQQSFLKKFWKNSTNHPHCQILPPITQKIFSKLIFFLIKTHSRHFFWYNESFYKTKIISEQKRGLGVPNMSDASC